MDSSNLLAQNGIDDGRPNETYTIDTTIPDTPIASSKYSNVAFIIIGLVAVVVIATIAVLYVRRLARKKAKTSSPVVDNQSALHNPTQPAINVSATTPVISDVSSSTDQVSRSVTTPTYPSPVQAPINSPGSIVQGPSSEETPLILDNNDPGTR